MLWKDTIIMKTEVIKKRRPGDRHRKDRDSKLVRFPKGLLDKISFSSDIFSFTANDLIVLGSILILKELKKYKPGDKMPFSFKFDSL
jgi:hypothetical protein